MKAYNIFDEELQMLVGILLYYEKDNTCVVELSEGLDEWTSPLLFTAFVKKGIFSIPRDVSMAWVRSRVIPKGRQNINAILKTHKLKEYDEIKLMELSSGRCSQDSIYIKRTNEIPDFVKERFYHHVSECFISGEDSIICFFKDKTIRKIKLQDLEHINGMEKVIKNEALKNSLRPTCDGFSISFDNSIEIPCELLYKSGIHMPLSPDDFTSYVKNNLMETSECCRALECSRQNLSYLVNEKKIKPIRQLSNNALYSKGDIYGSSF